MEKSAFIVGFEKQAFQLNLRTRYAIDDVVEHGLVGAGAGALFGGEKQQGEDGKVNRTKGAIRGALAGMGLSAGHTLGRKIGPSVAVASGLLGGVGGYQAGKLLGGKYNYEKKE